MTRRIFLVAMVLVMSFGLRRWLNHDPGIPMRETLASFPKEAGPWTMISNAFLDDSISGVLKADDYILRTYLGESGQQVELFIAYYKTQKAGESMHSPKNCLPGSGWDVVRTDEVALWPTDSNNSTRINRYLIEKNGQKALVLYWYQANGRVIANEYWGKLYLVVDALRTGRRDGAIVRLIVSVPKGSAGDGELEAGLEMARAAVPLLPKYIPN